MPAPVHPHKEEMSPPWLDLGATRSHPLPTHQPAPGSPSPLHAPFSRQCQLCWPGQKVKLFVLTPSFRPGMLNGQPREDLNRGWPPATTFSPGMTGQCIASASTALAALSYLRQHKTVLGNRRFCYVEEQKKPVSLSYLCHRLLEQFWMHPSPLRTSSPKLLASRNHHFFKSLLIYSVIWVWDHFWVFLQTVANTPQPSLTYRLYTLARTQFNTQKTSLQQDNQAQHHLRCRKLSGTWWHIPRYSRVLNVAEQNGGKGP